MNNVNLIGRLVRNVEIKQTNNGKRICNFSLAIRRSENDLDFVSCVAFDKVGDILCQYCDKGSQIGINGSIRAGMTDNKYFSNVVVNSIFLLGSKNNNNDNNKYNSETYEPKPTNYNNYNDEVDDYPF